MKDSFSRRSFLKNGAIVAAGAAALGLAGCGSPTKASEAKAASSTAAGAATREVSMQAGTYSATVDSIKGKMTVNTTVSENTITGISVQAADTRHIMQKVIEEMVPSMIKNQSTDVDTISGATLSSAALKQGVTECLSQAGADAKAFDVDCKTKAVDAADEEFDVVVVGSGAAGLSTAIQCANNGLGRIVVLDKLGFYGGTTGLSSGGVWTCDTEFNEATGYNFTPDSLVKHMYDTTGLAEGSLNDELIKNVASVASEVYTEYHENGSPWDTQRYTFGDALQEMPVSWAEMFWTADYENNAGSTLIDFMVRYALYKGVEIRLNSKVSGILTDASGAVTGVSVEARDKNYNANAKKVVFATGGFQRNEELVEKLAPQHKTMVPFTSAGSTGDAITYATEIGAATFGNGVAGSMGLDASIGYCGPDGATTYCTNLRVNKEGKRFMNEASHYSTYPDAVCSQTDGTVYGIADSTNANVEILEQLVEQGRAFRADSLQALAAAAGIDASALEATVQSYNTTANSGADDSEFGTPNASMTPAQTAPFYAITTHLVSFAVLAGLKANENCAILDENDSPIPNLFGAGEVVAGNLFTQTYPGSGSQIGSGIYEGKIIADQIAKEIA